MGLQEFKALVNSLKLNHPIWFDLDSDKLPSILEIKVAQERLNITLPKDYIDFINEFGGGYFALSNVYSLEAGSDWNIVDQNLKYANICKDYIIISENGTGDFYGYKVEDGVCKPHIHFYDHDEDSWQETEFFNLFEYLDKLGLTN